eukprot:Lankesteria_metandrocarpae@DN1179_c0_g1_i2.p1
MCVEGRCCGAAEAFCQIEVGSQDCCPGFTCSPKSGKCIVKSESTSTIYKDDSSAVVGSPYVSIVPDSTLTGNTSTAPSIDSDLSVGDSRVSTTAQEQYDAALSPEQLISDVDETNIPSWFERPHNLYSTLESDGDTSSIKRNSNNTSSEHSELSEDDSSRRDILANFFRTTLPEVHPEIESNPPAHATEKTNYGHSGSSGSSGGGSGSGGSSGGGSSGGGNGSDGSSGSSSGGSSGGISGSSSGGISGGISGSSSGGISGGISGS